MNYKDSTISVCPECISIWLDLASLERIVATSDSVWPPGVVDKVMGEAPMLPQNHVHCPDCDHQLQAAEFFDNPHIVLNSCLYNHGVWLNPGDLARIQIVARYGVKATTRWSRQACEVA